MWSFPGPVAFSLPALKVRGQVKVKLGLFIENNILPIFLVMNIQIILQYFTIGFFITHNFCIINEHLDSGILAPLRQVIYV